jgi:tetratricopeptide (TPR) repeat protein
LFVLLRQQFRLPHLAVRYGVQLLQHASGKLGNAVWDLYERVVAGACDAHDYVAASWALGELEAQWPGSVRVARLRGMEAEARGHYAEAEHIYAQLLEKDPTDVGAARRQIAVQKAQGHTGAAIALLTKFVRSHASDESAWLELSELYCVTQQYELAAFALEELLLLTPENYLYHTRYAELAATLGHWDTARQYYAQALELKPNNNLRALWGLQLALQRATGVVASGRSAGGRGAAASVPPPSADATAKLVGWTEAQIKAHYAKFAPQLASVAAASVAAVSVEAPAAAAASSTAAPAVAASGKQPAAAESAKQTSSAAPTADDVDEPASPQEADLPD